MPHEMQRKRNNFATHSAAANTFKSVHLYLHNKTFLKIKQILALFPDLFDHLQYAKTERAKACPFYQVNDISVYLGRQMGGGVPDRKSAFHAHVLRFEPGAVRFLCYECSKYLGQKLQEKASLTKCTVEFSIRSTMFK